MVMCEHMKKHFNTQDVAEAPNIDVESVRWTKLMTRKKEWKHFRNLYRFIRKVFIPFTKNQVKQYAAQVNPVPEDSLIVLRNRGNLMMETPIKQ